MSSPRRAPIVERWHPSLACCDREWEEAYRRFESPAEEVEKFRRRLVAAGAEGWPRDSEIAELFCGRGSGLHALSALGFARLSGVDLSEDLLASHDGFAQLYLGDCRDLKFPARSLDVVVVQGGLHHLPDLHADLERTLLGIRRVLRANGRFVVVEPWRTPFLSAVLALGRIGLARRAWGKLDAFAVMVERERETYFRWLAEPEAILRRLAAHFVPERQRIAWGSLLFVGTPRPD